MWTKAKYARYEAAFKRGTKGLEYLSSGPCPGCEGCGLGPRPCKDCGGTGETEDGQPCPQCEGKGEKPIDSDSPEYREACDCRGDEFSWSACDICGSGLGGTREPAHGRDKDGALVHLSICVDCLYYMEHGQLDDMSMMEIENDKGED